MLKKLFLTAIFTGAVFFLYSQDKKNATLDQYIEILEDKLLELKQNENELNHAENNLFSAHSLHDVDFTGSISAIGKKPYNDTTSTIVDYSAGYKVDGSLQTTLPVGTRLSFGGEYVQMHSWGSNEQTVTTYLGGIPDEQELNSRFNSVTYDPALKIGVVQPLCYNWFGFLDRAAKKDARLKVQISKLQKEANDLSVLNYYKRLYFTWIKYEQMLFQLKRSIANAQVLEQQSRNKVSQRIAENDELQNAIHSVLIYREKYRQIEIAFLEITDELSVFFDVFSIRPDKEEFDRYMQKSFDLETNFVDFENTRTSQILQLTKEDMEFLRKVNKNKTLPKVNLFANVDVKFHTYANRTNFSQDSMEDKSTRDESTGDVDFTAGLEVSYSIINHKERGVYKAIKLEIEGLNLEYESAKNNYNQVLKSTITNLQKYKDLYNIKTTSIKTLRSMYATQTKKYSQGRMELDFVLNTANSIANEEMDLIQIQYNLILLYLKYNELISI